MSENLQKLASLCKCSVHVTLNANRTYHLSAGEWIKEEIERDPGLEEELPFDVRERMIATQTVVDLTFFPDTSVGSYRIIHYDLELALAEALSYSCFIGRVP